MAGQLLGKAYVRVDGTLYETLSGAKISNVTGIERDGVTGTSVLGFVEKVVIPTLDCDMPATSDLSVEDLGAITDSTITFECDNGPVYILSNAWNAKAGTPTADGSGKIEGVQFMAITGNVQMS
jgi:hypothetical protein